MSAHAARRAGFLEIIWPIARAAVLAAVGYAIGSFGVAVIRGGTWTDQLSIVAGFGVGLLGWLLGGGAFEAWVRPWFGHENTWNEGHGITRFFRYNTDHKVIGIQYMWAAGFAFLVAGLIAMGMRAELLTPQLDFFTNRTWYNTAVSIHGSLMLFSVSVVAIVGGFGNYFVPLMVGADDMVFPQVNGISWWFVLPGIMALLLSPLLGGFETGWTGYAPLATTDEAGQLLYYLGVFSLGISSMLTGVNVIGTAVYMRAPGLTWNRIPMFVWAMIVTSVLNVMWVPVIGVDMMMGVMDRVVPTAFFGAKGFPLLWQDLFWLFGHPEVYIIMLTGWGLWLEIIPVFSRKTLFAYRWAVIGFIAIALLSGTVWVHHMFTAVSAARLIPFMTDTEIISIPTGFIYLSLIGTLFQGRLRLTTPMLFALFSALNFLIGGGTGIFLSDVPSDFQLQDTFFVVAHFHYTILGGMIFAWFAGLYYWFPKFSGRMYNEFWGKFSAWWMLVFFNLTFFTMFVSGLEGMNRRIATYLPNLTNLNVFTSINGFLFGVGFFVPLLNFLISAYRGQRAPANPWGAKTLEWMTSSPPPHENFETIPIVREDFYGYGEVREPEQGLFPNPTTATPTSHTTGDD